MMQHRTTPQAVKNLISKYKKLEISGIAVKTPYYRNVKRVRAGLRSLIGKGSPDEIQEETLIYAKLKGFSFDKKNEREVREFMQSQGIGVDCSGFVSNILERWLKEEKKGSLYKHLKFPNANLYRKIVIFLRTIENSSAEILTNSDNTVDVQLKEVECGDLIRLSVLEGSSGKHIAIVIDVERGENGTPISFTYVHSTENYSTENGIKEGKVIIENENGELRDQRWLEPDKNEIDKNWTFEKLIKEYDDNGLRRPKFFLNI